MPVEKEKPVDPKQDPAEDKALKGNKEKGASAVDPKQDDGLVEMSRGEEVLRVHPSCVADHERIGFRAV